MKTNHSILLAAVFAVSVGFISCGTMGDSGGGGSNVNSGDDSGGDSSSSNVSNTQCRDSQNRILYCNWDSGCYALDPMNSEPLGQTCDYYAENCQRYGALYIGVSQEGDGIHCSNSGGTLVSSVSSSSSRQLTSSSSSEQMVYCKHLTNSSGSTVMTCSQMSYSVCKLMIDSGIAEIVSSCYQQIGVCKNTRIESFTLCYTSTPPSFSAEFCNSIDGWEWASECDYDSSKDIICSNSSRTYYISNAKSYGLSCSDFGV